MSKDIGDVKSKYAIQVYATASASKYVGTIFCNTEEEYNQLVDDNYDLLHDEGSMSVNIHNDFDMGDIEIEEIDFSKDSKCYENKNI